MKKHGVLIGALASLAASALRGTGLRRRRPCRHRQAQTGVKRILFTESRPIDPAHRQAGAAVEGGA